MRQVDIEVRRKKILLAIVESYIDTANPVGSRAISQHFRYSISPATIRNVMADLEDDGHIMQPHTSAGRVPTDKGYRFYVDSLMEHKRLTKEEELLMSKLLRRAGDDIDSLLENASKAISTIANVAGIVLTPRLKRSFFKHIEFIPVDSLHIMGVLITGSGIVKNFIMDSEEEIERSQLYRIAEFLNEELEGMMMGDIRAYLTRRLLEERDSFYIFLKKAMDILKEPSLFRTEDRMYFDGAAILMSQPEFREASKMRLFLEAFEEKKDLLDLFNHDMETDGIKIHIGSENHCKYIQSCALITCNYKVKEQTIGAVGAIGPTRMEYGKVISAVQYLSNTLGKVLEDLG